MEKFRNFTLGMIKRNNYANNYSCDKSVICMKIDSRSVVANTMSYQQFYETFHSQLPSTAQTNKQMNECINERRKKLIMEGMKEKIKNAKNK